MPAPATSFVWAILAALVLAAAAGPHAQDRRPRARDLGIAPGMFDPGPLNTITDVAGVKVGHTTIIQGDSVRTGVTAILPHGGHHCFSGNCSARPRNWQKGQGDTN